MDEKMQPWNCRGQLKFCWKVRLFEFFLSSPIWFWSGKQCHMLCQHKKYTTLSAFHPFLSCMSPTCVRQRMGKCRLWWSASKMPGQGTCKVSLTRSQQDLIKPINLYRAAIIPDLWTPSAGKSCWFSNSMCPSLYRDLTVQVISLRPFKRRSWVVSVLKGSSTYCSNKAECDSSSTSKT